MTQENAVRMLESGTIPARYQKNIGTIGVDGQLLLLKAKVAVVGAGGLGGNIIELLTRQGVGFLRIIDGDCFAGHNLNRQLLATERNLGMNKAEAAVRRIADVNSDVVAEAVPQMLDENNAAEFLAGIEVVMDALDSLSARRLLARTARALKIPMIHGAIGGFTGRVTTLLPEGGADLEKLFPDNSGEVKGIESILGNPATTPALTAALQVQEAVKVITGIGEPLDRQMLYFDTQFNLFEVLRLK
ncbi:MAG TPA: HesA/MoeB/ThiF family protein [Patescibacteria group bacterium]|nr:HesA/MoeB/ThiF family protein [Patescibacteria group bacterium]